MCEIRNQVAMLKRLIMGKEINVAQRLHLSQLISIVLEVERHNSIQERIISFSII